MRFTLCSIASAALLLGSCPEPVQATSLLDQYDSQGAFNELLQLDAGLDLEADPEDGKTADLHETQRKGGNLDKMMWGSKPKEDTNLAKAIDDFVNILARQKVDIQSTVNSSKADQKTKLSIFGYYCDQERSGDQEITAMQFVHEINQKVHAIRDAIDKANVDRNSGVNDFKTLARFDDMIGMVELANSKLKYPRDGKKLSVEQQEMFDKTVLELQAKSLVHFKELFGEDFVKDVVKVGEVKEIKTSMKTEVQNKMTWSQMVNQLILDVNAWAGLQSGTYEEGGKDERSYYGSELYAKNLIKEACNPERKNIIGKQRITAARSDQAFLHNLEVLM